MFRDAGFDTVEMLINVGNLEFKRAIRKFEATADQADIAVVYYAGHGLEIGGTNYLIPIDARLASDRDADDEAIPLERLVSSGRWRQAVAPRHPRRVPRQSLRHDDEARASQRSDARRQRRSRQGRADQHRHADRLRGESRLDRRRRRRRAQPVHHGGAEEPDRAGSRYSPRLRTRPGRGVEGDRQPAGAVRLRSLGGGTISLVPAPAVPQEAPVSDVKADYDLVQKIGTKRAWEVFLGDPPDRLLCRSRAGADRGLEQAAAGDPAECHGRRPAADAGAARSRRTDARSRSSGTRSRTVARYPGACSNSSNAFPMRRWRSPRSSASIS